ncbi:MAG: FtsX-like permease family protein, partial [Phycisphaerae bacterium]
LTLRYLRKRRIAYFAIAAVTLCVAMVLIVMSIMGGWLEQVKLRARGLLGDVIVDNAAYSGFPLYQEFIDEISAWPEIVKATPVIYTYGLYEFQGTSRNGMVRVVGIRLEEVYEVNAFKESLFYERYYPGTTTLAPQRQPILGVDLDAPLIVVREEDRAYVRPRLPEPYQAALAQSRAAGAVDDDSTETYLNNLLAKLSLSPIPGVYEGPLGPEQGPLMEGNELPGIIVGRDIIAYRESDGRYTRPESLPRGCKVLLTVTAVSGGSTIDTPSKTVFRYADDSRTGIYEIDSQHVYCDFGLLQKLLQMDAAERVDPETLETIGTVPARCSQIQIKIAEGVDVRALCRRLEETYHGYLDDPRFDLDTFESRLVSSIKALTWQESQAHIIGPVEKERILVTILFGIISLVAVTLVLCILYMIVLQKTRDIGIVKSIGGSSGGVAFIFILYGAAVGVAGSILGTILGTLFVTYINEIQDFLIQLNPAWRVWDMQVYSFDRIPSEVNPWDAVTVVITAIIASTAGSFVAAWRAGRMQPVEAVRYE